MKFWYIFLAISGMAKAATLPQVAPGFKVELLRSAAQGGDSWVCMTSDPSGHLIISPQGPGGYLIEVTLSSQGQVAEMKRIDRPVGSAMGLAYAFDSLYVDGDGPKGFGVYRLRHDAATGQYGWPTLITQFAGYPPHEHGAHGIAAGPDNRLYIVCGDLVRPPSNISPASPLRNFGTDQLLPQENDPDGVGLGAAPPEGFVVRMGPDGEEPELFCGGLRNVYAIAFNSEGEAFGFDNDPNNNWGLPWYRPNSLYHLVSGADYGYRQGTAAWPHDYPDAWPALMETGLGCPTGLKFGYRSNFPVKYKTALFALDWCSGRIFTVYLTPKGAGYEAAYETFVHGKPLNVTDLDFGPDGSMYFITGGRKIQSILYRVSYIGEPEKTNGVPATPNALRELRQALERYHGRPSPEAIEFAWPSLGSDDPLIRSAARLAIESQPVSQWQGRALSETRTNASLIALLALARCGPRDSQEALLVRLAQWPMERLSQEEQLEKLRVLELSFIRQGEPGAAHANAIKAELDRYYPSANARLNAELCQLLVYLQSPDVVPKTLALLDAAPSREEQIRYIFCLRHQRTGWTLDQRKRYFAWFTHPSETPPSPTLKKWFTDAGRPYSDGSSVSGYLDQFRQEAIDSLTPSESGQLAPWLATNRPPQSHGPAPKPRPFVKNWAVADIVPLLDTHVTGGASPVKGKEVFIAAGCSQCHRFGGSGGTIGPDLTTISSSNSRRDILESILEPSKVIADQYRNTTLVTRDGDELSGRVVADSPSEVTLMTDLLNRTVVKVRQANIQKREVSNISPMPQGLLDSFSGEEILDLLDYLETAGN